MNCNNCNQTFTPKTESQKYCSNKCRVDAFNRRKYASINEVKQELNEPFNAVKNEFYSSEMMERLLSERDKYHQADKERIKAEYETKMLEARLVAIEKRMEEDDKPSMVEKFMTPEVISGLIQLATPKAPK
jgi:hypothetical protein